MNYKSAHRKWGNKNIELGGKKYRQISDHFSILVRLVFKNWLQKVLIEMKTVNSIGTRSGTPMKTQKAGKQSNLLIEQRIFVAYAMCHGTLCNGMCWVSTALVSVETHLCILAGKHVCLIEGER